MGNLLVIVMVMETGRGHFQSKGKLPRRGGRLLVGVVEEHEFSGN